MNKKHFDLISKFPSSIGSDCLIMIKNSILLMAITFLPLNIFSQTCPNGSATAATGYCIVANGGASGAANATGTILSSGSTLNAGNSATSSTTVDLIQDLQKWVAQGSTLTIAWARSSGTPTGNVFISNDNSTYTLLGTLSGSGSTSSVYANFTVPSGGLRYIKIIATAGVFFIDGARYTHTCYYRADAIKDTRVVLSPGTARGDLSANDKNYDNDAKSYSIYNTVSNGTLVFNSTGTFTYKPTSGFEGVDEFSYILTDAGPDGNIATVGDNWRDTALVTFRTLFNCDSTSFYVPLPENEALDFLKDISLTLSPNNDPTVVYLGISVATDAIVIYDHWEDGFESDIKAPSQTSTQIWGDGDLTNGIAPGFPTDILNAGQAIILSNSLSSGHSGSTSYNPNAAGSDATLQATIDYDGKDRVFIGGIGAMTKLAWGSLGTVSVSGSAVTPTKKWGTAYVLPVGINTPNSGNSFQISSLSIIAKEAGTTVNIDRDANGTIDITVVLAQGETYYVDSRVSGSAVAVNQGATINATKPIQVTLLTGQYNTFPYQSRTYSLIPNAQASTCYYMPAVPQETMRVFFYNANASGITVTQTTAGGATTSISVAANSSAYIDVNNSGLAYKYCSSSVFMILSQVDYNSGNSDWGFIPVPSSNLTSLVLVGYGDGEDPLGGTLGTNNYEQALVTADCNTYLYVDVNGDGDADNVSFNNDVDATDATVTIGGINYNETTSGTGIYLQAYQTVTIGSTSGSLSGAVFWTKTVANNAGSYGCNIVVVWGQNGGPTAAPNIDAGYTIPNISTEIINQTIKSSDSIMVGQNADSIKVKYSGAVAPYKVFWFNETTNTYSVFTTTKDSFTINNLEPGNYLIKLRDAICRSFTQRVLISEIPSAAVSGRIFRDANGQTNGIIDGVATRYAGTSQLFAYLVKSSGVIADSAKVQSNGSFTLLGRQLWNYTVRISTTEAGIGSAAPPVNLPANWVNVAEQFGSGNGSGTGVESGTANGMIASGIGALAISAVNFSIEKQTLTHDKTYNISPDSVVRQHLSGNTRFPRYILLYNASGTADTTVTGTGTTMPGRLSGSDLEDGRFRGSTGSNGKLAFTQLPDSATDGVLVYNGVLLFANPIFATPAYAYWNTVTSRYEIPSFNPSLLKLFVKVNYQTNSLFRYAYIDNANVLGRIATYRINYLIPLPVRIDFEGEMSGTKAKLNWTCYNKENIVSYDLERVCSENSDTIKIVNVKDNGENQYVYFDELSDMHSNIYEYFLYSINNVGERKHWGVVELENIPLIGSPKAIAYPNPASGELSLKLEGFNDRFTKNGNLYSADGRLISSFQFQGNSTYLNIESLAEGIYFINVTDSKLSANISLVIRR